MVLSKDFSFEKFANVTKLDVGKSNDNSGEET